MKKPARWFVLTDEESAALDRIAERTERSRAVVLRDLILREARELGDQDDDEDDDGGERR